MAVANHITRRAALSAACATAAAGAMSTPAFAQDGSSEIQQLIVEFREAMEREATTSHLHNLAIEAAKRNRPPKPEILLEKRWCGEAHVIEAFECSIRDRIDDDAPDRDARIEEGRAWFRRCDELYEEYGANAGEAEWNAAHDRFVELEHRILEMVPTCKADAEAQLEVMRATGYMNRSDTGDECARASRVAENIAALLA
jgi:predicted secreted protein